MRRLREWRNGSNRRSAERSSVGDADLQPKPSARTLGDDDKLVIACLRVGDSRRIDPFLITRQITKDWTRERWEADLEGYESNCF